MVGRLIITQVVNIYKHAFSLLTPQHAPPTPPPPLSRPLSARCIRPSTEKVEVYRLEDLRLSNKQRPQLPQPFEFEKRSSMFPRVAPTVRATTCIISSRGWLAALQYAMYVYDMRATLPSTYSVYGRSSLEN